MQVRAKNARCIGKDTHTWDDGSTIYRALFNNDSGDILRAQFPENMKAQWQALELYDTRYEVAFEARTSGYKTYIDVTSISASK